MADGKNTLLMVMTLLCLSPAIRGDHLTDNNDLNIRLGDLFWTVFILSVFGFFIYLVCAYAVSEPPPPPSSSHRREESVVNVRILNLPELLNPGQSSHGRAFPPQPYSPA
jgi:hypothetical protein